MNTTNLPALDYVQPLAGHAALLILSTGRRVTVATADRVIFAPEPGVLIVHGKGYAVPPALFAVLRVALKLEGAAQ